MSQIYSNSLQKLMYRYCPSLCYAFLTVVSIRPSANYSDSVSFGWMLKKQNQCAEKVRIWWRSRVSAVSILWCVKEGEIKLLALGEKKGKK